MTLFSVESAEAEPTGAITVMASTKEVLMDRAIFMGIPRSVWRFIFYDAKQMDHVSNKPMLVRLSDVYTFKKVSIMIFCKFLPLKCLHKVLV